LAVDAKIDNYVATRDMSATYPAKQIHHKTDLRSHPHLIVLSLSSPFIIMSCFEDDRGGHLPAIHQRQSARHPSITLRI
jgi:hypothetical protein